MKWFVAFLAFAVLQGALFREPSRAGRKTLLTRFPGATQTMVYGGFQPVLVQWLWYEYAISRKEGRVLDTLKTLEVLKAVEPDNSRALRFLAHVLAHDMAERETSPREKVLRVLDGLRVLEEAERRSEVLGRDPHLPALRGQILQGIWTSDVQCLRAFRARRHHSPLEECWHAWSRAQTLAPGSFNVRLSAADAGRQHAIEILVVNRDRKASLTVLDQAVALLDPATREASPLVSALVDAWRDVVASLDLSGDLAQALERLTAAVEETPDDEFLAGTYEARLAWAALPQLLSSAESVRAADPTRSLSVVMALRRIQAIAAQRIARTGPVSPPEERYAERWGSLLDALEKDLPERATELVVLRVPW